MKKSASRHLFELMISAFRAQNAKFKAKFRAAAILAGNASQFESACLHYLGDLFDSHADFALPAALAASNPGEVNPRYGSLLENVKQRLLAHEFERMLRSCPANRLGALRARASALLDAKVAAAVANAEEFIAAAATRRKRKPTRRPDLQVAAIRTMVRKLKKQGMSQREICDFLRDSVRPPNARWRNLSWPKAYADPRYQQSVKSWISEC